MGFVLILAAPVLARLVCRPWVLHLSAGVWGKGEGGPASDDPSVSVGEWMAMKKGNPHCGLPFVGGTWRSRTALNGFADRYLTVRTRYRNRFG